MSYMQEVFYTIECDHVGCRANIVEAAYDDDGAYLPTRADVQEVWDQYAEELGWKLGPLGVCHYCPEHAAIHLDPTEVDADPVVDPTPPPPPLFPDLEAHS